MFDEIIYDSTVTKIGKRAQELISEGIMIFFNESAPEELSEYSIVHKPIKGPMREVKKGDIMFLDGRRYPIVDVGSRANENLRMLGHVSVKRSDIYKEVLPGDIIVDCTYNPFCEAKSSIRIISSSKDEMEA